MIRRFVTAALLATAILGLGAKAALADVDPVESGRDAYQEQCMVCHQVTPGEGGEQGPALNGVVGRKVAAVSGFAYTPGLAAKGGSWTPETLDVFLSDPTGYAPGIKMPVNVGDARTRRELIAYLATTK